MSSSPVAAAAAAGGGADFESAFGAGLWLMAAQDPAAPRRNYEETLKFSAGTSALSGGLYDACAWSAFPHLPLHLCST
jgi:hypothetical protein